MAGLDPAIDPLQKILAKSMDTRVKPAYDGSAKFPGAIHVLRYLRSSSEARAVGCLSRTRQDAQARTRADRRLCRQHPLSQPQARRMAAVAVGLARREGAGALAYPGEASCGAGEGPRRNISRLSFADRPADAGHQAA